MRPMTQAGTTHHVEEQERRFSDAIVEWLRGKAEEHRIDHWVVFAPPRMLGILRKDSSGLLRGQLEELQGNLMGLRAGQLAEHPVVRRLAAAARER